MCEHCVSRANTSTKQIESQVSANHPLTPRSDNNGMTFKGALDGSQIGPWIVTGAPHSLSATFDICPRV
jgi:hypothetical protein